MDLLQDFLVDVRADSRLDLDVNFFTKLFNLLSSFI